MYLEHYWSTSAVYPKRKSCVSIQSGSDEASNIHV